MLENVMADHCPSIDFANSTNTNSISDKDFSNAFVNVSNIVKDYSEKLNVPFGEALHDINEYAKTRIVLVAPTGFAKVYNVATNTLVVAGSSVKTLGTIAAAQVSGRSGGSLLASSPVSVIAVPTMLGMSFAYLECLSRGTMIAPVFHVTARVCLITLKIAEITVNNVVLVIPSRIIGIPLIANASSVVLNGFGIY